MSFSSISSGGDYLWLWLVVNIGVGG